MDISSLSRPQMTLMGSAFCAMLSMHFTVQLLSQHLFYWKNPKEQKAILIIILMAPLYAIVSFVGLLDIQGSKEFFTCLESVKECYEALVIAKFMALMYNYLNISISKNIVPDGIKGREIHHSFPMTLFQPHTVKLDYRSLKLLKHWTWQFVIIRPVCSVLMITLQLIGFYPDWLSWTFTIILNVSVSLALYSLVVFYHVFAKELAPHKPLAKFMCIKGIVFFCFWQGIVLEGLVAMGIIRSHHFWLDVEHIEEAIQNVLVCLEMVIFSVLQQYAYHVAPYSGQVEATMKNEVTKKYKEAKSNLSILHGLGANILHGVDATKMKFHNYLMSRRFDRIVFNFPHAGFKGREDSSRVIKMHRALVDGFFSNANSMLRPDGEIHITHKTTAPFSNWKLEELASSSSLALIERAKFKKEDYPNYNLKRGDGRRCDQPFPCGESSTFKFRFTPNLHKSHQSPKAHYWGSIRTRREYLFDQNLISKLDRSNCTTGHGHYWGSIRTSPDYSFDRRTYVRPRGTNPEFDHLVGPAPGRSVSQRLQFLPESDHGRISYDDDDYRSGFNGGSTGIESRLSYYDIGRVNASRLVRKYGNQDEHFSGEGNLRITRIIP